MGGIEKIAKFLHTYRKGMGHRKYSYSYYLCTGLNLLNVIINIILLDIFIDGQFLSLGSRWMSFSGREDDQLLTRIFPRMVMCQWRQFGSGGHQEIQNHICMLATNVVTEKLFIFLWFWLNFLLVLSAISFVYFSLLLFSGSERVRNYFLMFAVRVKPSKFEGALEKRSKEERLIGNFLRRLPAANFLFLYILSGNVDHRTLLAILFQLRNLSQQEAEHARQDKQGHGEEDWEIIRTPRDRRTE